jgi:hypothetical protein
MKDFDTIHESFLEPGTKFTLRGMTVQQVHNTRKAFINITAMMWICNRAKIIHGYLDQGRTLIMIWKN